MYKSFEKLKEIKKELGKRYNILISASIKKEERYWKKVPFDDHSLKSTNSHLSLTQIVIRYGDKDFELKIKELRRKAPNIIKDIKSFYESKSLVNFLN